MKYINYVKRNRNIINDYSNYNICKSLFSVINVINNCLDYQYSDMSTTEMENELINKLMILELFYLFKPSNHDLVHLVLYLKCLGPLSHNGTTIYERSYKQVRKITVSNKKKLISVINSMELMNSLNIYLYKQTDNKYKYHIQINNSQTVEQLFQSYTHIKKYSVISYFDENVMRFGIIRKKNNNILSINEIIVNRISKKIYKIVIINNNITIDLDINKTIIFNNLYKQDNEYYIFISDLVEYEKL